MMYRTICTMCVHFGAYDTEENSELVTCAAFPAGIPDEILRQGFDHRGPFEGDQGVQFEPKGQVDQDRIDAVLHPKTERNPANW